jgi:hypothetical protein
VATTKARAFRGRLAITFEERRQWPAWHSRQRGFGEPVAITQTAIAQTRLGWVDMALVLLFLLGLYTHYTVQISARVPFPSAPAGLAGLVLLWRGRDAITPRVLAALAGVILLYLVSILCATNLAFLGRRFNGLVQLVYSLVIGAALFLTVVRASRRQMEKMFLGFALVLLVGCLLEDYTSLRAISDAVRERLYTGGVYENDLRDTLLYGRIRPKFFASEPASVTFVYALCSFLWMVLSQRRAKLAGYLALGAVGAFAMPGPTLLLMLLLIVPYELFLAWRRPGDPDGRQGFAHLAKVAVLGLVMVVAFYMLAHTLFEARMREIAAGNDPSFFYRVLGPALAARDIVEHYPIAGAGLTGEPFVESDVVNVYVRSAAFSSQWKIVTPSTELLINYFWLHWIYLGAVWGIIMVVAVTIWLRVLGVASAGFCWTVWAILGQASGAYVGPTAWAVLYLAGAATVLIQRVEETQPAAPARSAEMRWRETVMAARAPRRAIVRPR